MPARTAVGQWGDEITPTPVRPDPMFHRLIRIVLLLSFIGGLALPSVPTTRACSRAMPRGEEHSVEIASETALIVWDEKARKQHFIRRASFQAQVPYFGFLVPTPNQPEL